MAAIKSIISDKINIKTALLIGGEAMQKQLRQLGNRSRIIVGTPGRINDHLKRKSLNLSATKYLVLDETDRMLDMGFTPQIELILKFVPKDHQTLLFSATLPENIVRISERYLNKPERISTGSTSVPILVERDLILYESNIINEYIDERFPHPQLMPADPVQRARARLLLLNFERELFVNVEPLEKQDAKRMDKARVVMRDRLSQLAPVVAKSKFMLGEDFSMIDVALAPLLWRLELYGIELPKAAAPVLKYAERIFSRPAFFEALTPSEKVMRR